jgi:lactate dehydrogenase-like 2-hydroxyacid dehydrogenase
MKPFDVLMPAAGHRPVERMISERLPLHSLWLEADPQAWLAQWSPRIRAIMSSGPQAPVDADFMRRFPRLEIVASFGVGYDHIDPRSAAERSEGRPPLTPVPETPWRGRWRADG